MSICYEFFILFPRVYNILLDLSIWVLRNIEYMTLYLQEVQLFTKGQIEILLICVSPINYH
jgi:hypothetical protein